MSAIRVNDISTYQRVNDVQIWKAHLPPPINWEEGFDLVPFNLVATDATLQHLMVMMIYIS